MGAGGLVLRPASTISRRILWVAVCVGGYSQGLVASEFTYDIGYRAEYSDNIFRIPSERDAESDTISTFSAGLAYLENTDTLKARVVARADYRDYHRDTFEDETNLRLDGIGELFFMPQTLSWVLADGFRKVQVDPLQADTPANRENSNVFATGPNIYLRIGSVDTVKLEGRYGRAWVENLDIDNERDSFAVRWLHRRPVRNILSLNYEYLDVDYENSVLNTDFNMQNLFLRADIHGAKHDSVLDLGWTRATPERGDTLSDPLVRLNSIWRLSSISSAGLLYGLEYSDTGAGLLPSTVEPQLPGGVVMPPLGADIVSSEIYYLARTEVFYTRAGVTAPWTIRLFHRDIDYPVSTDDRQEKGGQISVRYLYSNTLSFEVFSTFTKFSYEQPVRDDRDVNAGMLLSYSLRPDLTTGLRLERFRRKSTDESFDYTDDRVTVGISYFSGSGAH
jgi:hypothetical protein